MMANVKIDEKQALKMASLIYYSDFRILGLGHFNINVNEFADILKVVFNEHVDTNALLSLTEIYEKLAKERL